MYRNRKLSRKLTGKRVKHQLTSSTSEYVSLVCEEICLELRPLILRLNIMNNKFDLHIFSVGFDQNLIIKIVTQ